MTKQASDHAISVIKAGLSAVPGVGGPIASLIGDYVPSAAERSTRLAMEELRQRIDSLGDRIDPGAVNQEEFAELFKSCYLVIVRTHQQKNEAPLFVLSRIFFCEKVIPINSHIQNSITLFTAWTSSLLALWKR